MINYSESKPSQKQQRNYFHLPVLLSITLALMLVPLAVMAEAPHNTSHHAPSSSTKHELKPIANTPALQISNGLDLKTLIPALARKQVVFVGEIHTRYDHHLTQLEIIRRLHAIHPDLVIGMESFQTPYQQHLDDFIHGKIDEQDMLRLTEYYIRWRYDYRLYAPILRYAQENAIPVIALNIPTELSRKVSRDGLNSLDEAERAQLPEKIDRNDTDYRQRLKKIYNHHSGGLAKDFENFLTAQFLWDEGMAQSIADYLASHPDTHMVVLAGRGHLAYGSGIPKRLIRRIPVSTAIVLNSWEEAIEPGLADVLLLPAEQTLPKAGKIGASLEEDESNGKVTIASCLPDSPCAAAGLKKNDQILSINEQKIISLADLRLIMWDKQPNDEISLKIKRQGWFSSPEELGFQIRLH